MFMLGNLDVIGVQIGIGGARARRSALEILRGALQSCPVCEDILSLLARVLTDQRLARAAKEADDSLLTVDYDTPEQEIHEALAYAQRLAAIGVGGAVKMARKAVQQLH